MAADCDFDPQVQYSQMSPGSANLMAFEQFSRENLRAIVQRRLEAQIETEEVIVEERLRGMMYDIMRMAQEDMLNQWRSSLHTVGRNSESRDVSETQSNPTNPPVTNNQDSTEGNIADLVVPPPSTDHVDAREALAEARVDKPRVADSGFFSFDTSSNTTEQPESRQSSSRDFLLSSQTSAPPDQSDQPSPTVADGSPPAEGLDNTVDDCPRNQANLSLSRSERDASAPTSATATSIDDLFGIGGAVPLDTDSHLFDSFGESFWDFSYPLDQQG
ncbi:hypothetical protein GTA08_BOTSDO07769 [Botryosphaeria dothidea]|uniref:Uncharacterized protein n=1 Tax=Botryosphaeria dothidea TaxID=55169 RepID=A0A8H4INL0_9PEZI|nr:hypothetical protein GTA08_BOTSDO07769 [Botryosphaeria dothidea]